MTLVQKLGRIYSCFLVVTHVHSICTIYMIVVAIAWRTCTVMLVIGRNTKPMLVYNLSLWLARKTLLGQAPRVCSGDGTSNHGGRNCLYDNYHAVMVPQTLSSWKGPKLFLFILVLFWLHWVKLGDKQNGCTMEPAIWAELKVLRKWTKFISLLK